MGKHIRGGDLRSCEAGELRKAKLTLPKREEVDDLRKINKAYL